MVKIQITDKALDLIKSGYDDTRDFIREFGEYLASECTACHKASSGGSNIPVIAGRPVKDFIIALYSYKLKTRRSQVMEMVADRLSDEEIAALAAYFSSLK